MLRETAIALVRVSVAHFLIAVWSTSRRAGPSLSFVISLLEGAPPPLSLRFLERQYGGFHS
jgi:hypothetical protein